MILYILLWLIKIIICRGNTTYFRAKTITLMQMQGPRELCETYAHVAEALEHLSCLNELTFDSKGVRLSRTGPFTLLQLSGIQPTRRGCLPRVFLFDVLALGLPIFDIYPTKGNRYSLRMLLETQNRNRIVIKGWNLGKLSPSYPKTISSRPRRFGLLADAKLTCQGPLSGACQRDSN